MESKTKTKITVQATVNAPIAEVWEKFNTPEHVTKWCAASDDWHVPHAESNFREGGKSLTRMEAKDGSFGFDFEWTYTKIDEHKTVHYTMADDRTAEITFEKTDNGIQVTETFEAEETNPIEMQQQGWQAILNNFRKYTENN